MSNFLKLIIIIIFMTITFLALNPPKSNNINNITNTDERIKYIFDFNWVEDFNLLSEDFKKDKNYMISIWEKSLSEYDYIWTEKYYETIKIFEDNINKSNTTELKVNLVLLKVAYESFFMKNLVIDVINLLKETENIDKDFYNKLYNIQINNFDKNIENVKENLKNYMEEEEYNNFINSIPTMREEYIKTTTNKNMLDKFNK